jgi:hypothetical protein
MNIRKIDFRAPQVLLPLLLLSVLFPLLAVILPRLFFFAIASLFGELPPPAALRYLAAGQLPLSRSPPHLMSSF